MPSSRTEAILVTGGRGFIGSRLVQHLVETQSATVLSADIRPIEGIESSGLQIDLDIRDRQSLHELFSRYAISIVFDLASFTEVGRSAAEYRPNLEMTQSMVESVLLFGVRKYVFYSTQLVFRKPRVLPSSDQDYYPIDHYGESKIQSEQWIRNNLPSDRCLMLRPTYIWGVGNRRFRDGFLYRLAKGQLVLPSSDAVTRYYGHVDTICRQTIALADRPIVQLPSRTFYVSDEAISIRWFCEFFLAAFGMGRFRQLPGAAIRMMGRVGDCAGFLGIPFPISGLQANELTRSYPVPIEKTLAIVGASTDYRAAAASVVTWALSDPDFRRRVGSR